MRLICNWRQRQLAQRAVLKAPLPPRSPLERHLAHCPGCAAAYQDLIRLQRDMLEPLPASTLSSDFDADLLVRFATEIQGVLPRQPSPTPPRLRPLALAAAIAAVVAGPLWINDVRTGVSDPATKTGAAPESQIRWDPQRMAFRSGQQLPASGTTPRPYDRSRKVMNQRSGPQHPRVHQRRRRSETPLRMMYASARRGQRGRQNQRLPQSEGTTVVRTTCTTTWRDLARVYEACGDYSRACGAYERAFTKQPDADLALAAGEAADRTGDSSRALIDLARLLSEGSSSETTMPDELEEK